MDDQLMDDCHISTSTSTITSIHHHHDLAVSSPPSPPSTGLPSPPDSPLSQADSVSSFPSVSSSFFFSSAAASPPHSHGSEHSKDNTQGLIIPHLTLPPPMRKPSTYGKALGDIRLLVVGDTKGITPNLLFDDNPDIVEISPHWEDSTDGTRAVRASTDWIEHKDAHGLERYEAVHNIEIVDVPCYDRNTDPTEAIAILKRRILEPFHVLSQVVSLKPGDSGILSNLLSSSSTPLCTAVIFFVHSPLSEVETTVLNSIGSLIPVVPFVHQHRLLNAPCTSAFHPLSSLSLRAGLLQAPETLSMLRAEAAQRFIHWLEVDRVVDELQQPSSSSTDQTKVSVLETWSKAKWESDIAISLAQSVALRRRDENRVQGTSRPPTESECVAPVLWSHFDPLHLPSVLLFSFSLFRPLRRKASASLRSLAEGCGLLNFKVAFLGGLCIGLGLGIIVN